MIPQINVGPSWIAFLVFTALFQFGRYLTIAGLIYFYFVRINKGLGSKLKIQKEMFEAKVIKREITFSFATAIIAAILSSPFHSSVTPFTKMYANVYDYGIAWLITSFLLLIVIYDTYFYWTHRLLHLPKIYKLVHSVHHKSTNTSPFTAYSFHPFEAFILFVWIVPVVFFIPIHHYVLLSFTILSMIINILGHSGFALRSKGLANNFFLKHINGATFHNKHHLYVHGNFSLYFSFWDSLMKTKFSRTQKY